MMRTGDLNPHVETYLHMVESGELTACKEQYLLAAYVRKCFATEDIYTDGDLLEKYLRLAKYFPYDVVFEWESFLLALHLCTFWRASKLPRWHTLFGLIGRGAGKDGYIALAAMALVSPYNKIKYYDVDICATSEEQAQRPMKDVIEVLENTKNASKLNKRYKKTMVYVKGIDNRGYIRGRTNNPKSKDGMRSGMIVFNEVHQYPDYRNIKVFETGLGKRPHPRKLFVTTNGDVREGPLDEYNEISIAILNGEQEDNGLLPFICRLDDKAEADDPAMWEKANPSLRHLPALRKQIEDEYAEWKMNPHMHADFMTKRMNLPQTDADVAVTTRENLIATNREMPDLTGCTCVAAIDYAEINDFLSVALLFRDGDVRYVISHSWLCLKSKHLERVKAPWREWAERGLLQPVDAVEIAPELVCNWLYDKMQLYNIVSLAIDDYRAKLLKRQLAEIGFDDDYRKNIKLVRPSDIIRVQPVIASAFDNHGFVWGDNPVLRWATNNTKLISTGRKYGEDIGNFKYAKIEAKSRKTDPFMALVHAMTIEDELPDTLAEYPYIPAIIA